MRLQKAAEGYSTEVLDHDERIHNMSQHLKNVKQELTHNLVRFNLQLLVSLHYTTLKLVKYNHVLNHYWYCITKHHASL